MYVGLLKSPLFKALYAINKVSTSMCTCALIIKKHLLEYIISRNRLSASL